MVRKTMLQRRSARVMGWANRSDGAMRIAPKVLRGYLPLMGGMLSCHVLDIAGRLRNWK